MDGESHRVEHLVSFTNGALGPKDRVRDVTWEGSFMSSPEFCQLSSQNEDCVLWPNCPLSSKEQAFGRVLYCRIISCLELISPRHYQFGKLVLVIEVLKELKNILAFCSLHVRLRCCDQFLNKWPHWTGALAPFLSLWVCQGLGNAFSRFPRQFTFISLQPLVSDSFTESFSKYYLLDVPKSESK